VAGIGDELQAILDATMDVVVVFDSERRFLSVNDAACRFYGAHARAVERLAARRPDRDGAG
jgi:PAS domain-containing protein